jgi:hypothetical protein
VHTWCRKQAHKALWLLLQQEGVPNTMVMDGSKEKVLGLFQHKCRQAGLHGKQTEPHSPWSNAAEGAIRELKQGTGHKRSDLVHQNDYGMIVLNDKPWYDLVLPTTYRTLMVTCHRLLWRVKQLTSLPLHYIAGMSG